MNFRLPMPVFQAPDTPSGGSMPSSSASASTPSTPTPNPTAPAPDMPSTPSPDSASEADAISLDFMFNPSDDSDGTPFGVPGLPVTEPTVTPKPTTEPPAPAQPAQKSTEAQPATPSPAPAPTESTSPQPDARPPATLDPYDPGALAQHLRENEAQAIQYAAENLFKLSPEDVEALESDVVGTIPKLLGRTLVASQRNFLMQLNDLVPRMIERHGKVTKAHTEAESEFYTRWSDIGNAKDQLVQIGDRQIAVKDLVTQYAVVYGQMHPNATRKERIEAVGPMVMMAAKIVPGVQPAAQASARPSPMAPTGRPQPTPFTPAGAVSGGASPTTPVVEHPAVAMFTHSEDV